MTGDIKLTIDQVAQIVGVNKSALRYWEKVYRIEPERSDGNQRRYSREQIELLLRIKSLMDEGYAVRGIKARLGDNHADQTVCSQEFEGGRSSQWS